MLGSRADWIWVAAFNAPVEETSSTGTVKGWDITMAGLGLGAGSLRIDLERSLVSGAAVLASE